MSRFFVGHASHRHWRAALAQAARQIDAQRAAAAQAGASDDAALGLVYFSDHFAAQAEPLLAALRERWPGVGWAGATGVGVCASGVEYFDEPALALMLCGVPAGRFRIFSGARALGGFDAATALVHADPATHDITELLDDMATRVSSGYLFGGVASSRTRACQVAEGVLEGGLSGVAFSRDVGLLSRVTQGCQPVGPARRIDACERNVVTELDGRPALDCLLEDLRISLDQPAPAMAALRATLVGLASPAPALRDVNERGPGASPPRARHRAFGADVRVRHLIGLDPGRQGVAVADIPAPGMTLAFCQRDVAAARRDLTRICAEIRDALAPEPASAFAPHGAAAAEDAAPADPTARIAGAVYVSCAGRGGPHFGEPSAELRHLRHALGDVPLVGFFAAGEIGHHHVYGYTGVLTVFTREAGR
jgi:small ligand-binding sensory domain FIST